MIHARVNLIFKRIKKGIFSNSGSMNDFDIQKN